MLVLFTDGDKTCVRSTQVFELTGDIGNIQLKIFDGDPITLYSKFQMYVKDVAHNINSSELLDLGFTRSNPSAAPALVPSPALKGVTDGERTMKEKAISWFKKLTRNQANMLMLRSTKLFNDLFDGTLDALSEYTDSYLQTMIDTVTSSFPEKSDLKPAWDFVHKFMIWYEGQDVRKLPDGYAVIWDHAEARDYASLFDIGQEMLTTAMQAAENSK